MSHFPALIADYITPVIVSCFILGVSCGSTFILILSARCIRSRIFMIITISIIIVTSARAGVWSQGTLILGISSIL
jgi:hypothetical protein